MKELLTEMIKAIVDKPDEVDISLTESENTVIYELRLGDGDVGKVIGKKGRNVTAIRTLLSAATAKAGGKRSILEIIEWITPLRSGTHGEVFKTLGTERWAAGNHL